MRQFLVRTLDKKFKVNADRMIVEKDCVWFMKSATIAVAVFYDVEYAYELAEGKDVVVYGIMDIENRYAKVVMDSTNLGEEN